ncbi:hypothetical protein B0H21DRAFT_712661 [Amylocystis lapponica]|nr:hypothetical protein B0H21DRAFT_712661 [Amylocystis lapponica]
MNEDWIFPPYQSYGHDSTAQGRSSRDENQAPFPQPSNGTFLQRSPQRLRAHRYPRTASAPLSPFDPATIPAPDFSGPLHLSAQDAPPYLGSESGVGWQEVEAGVSQHGPNYAPASLTRDRSNGASMYAPVPAIRARPDGAPAYAQGSGPGFQGDAMPRQKKGAAAVYVREGVGAVHDTGRGILQPHELHGNALAIPRTDENGLRVREVARAEVSGLPAGGGYAASATRNASVSLRPAPKHDRCLTDPGTASASAYVVGGAGGGWDSGRGVRRAPVTSTQGGGEVMGGYGLYGKGSLPAPGAATNRIHGDTASRHEYGHIPVTQQQDLEARRVSMHIATGAPSAATPSRAHRDRDSSPLFLPPTAGADTRRRSSPSQLHAHSPTREDIGGDISSPSRDLDVEFLEPSPEPEPKSESKPQQGQGVKTKKRVRAPPSTQARGNSTKKARGIGRATGKGAKSGRVNRRTGGTSDDEISKLSDAVKEEAMSIKGQGTRGLTPQEKLLVVQYITEEKRWTDLRLKSGQYFRELAQTILHGRVTPLQVQNYWNNQAYDKYKACRENLVEHTGGGDGDDSDAGDSELDEYGERTRKRKREISQNLKGCSGYSHLVLEEFLNSGLYDLIDRVAQKDNSVVRDREFNSAADVSGDESSSRSKRARHAGPDEDLKTGEVLNRVVATMEMRARSTEAVAQEQLALAKARDARDCKDRDAERAARHAKLELEKRELHMKERAQALEMMKHPDPEVQEEGKRLLKSS